MSERLDVILFGATGLVGRYAVEHLQRLYADNHFTWGIAGRNEKKLKNVLMKVQEETGDKSLAKVPIILADMYDQESIKAMTAKTKTLINVCGPLRVIGEIVVKACIETRTNYVDVSAEENFIDKVQLEYHEQAKAAGIYMVGACGVDCLVYDLGIIHLQKKFPGTINSVETYLKMDVHDKSITGPSYNVSTWRSTIDLMLNKRELKALQARIFSKKMPKLEPELHTKHFPFQPQVEKGWSILLTGSDRSVMMRTQQYLYEEKNIRPIQIQTYFMLKALWHLIFFVIFGLMFAILVHFKLGRKILNRYPAFFSCGVFGSEEPSEKMCKSSWARITFVTKGWKDKFLGANENISAKPNLGMVLEVKGQNVAYKGTALCMVLAGIMLSKEKANLPATPGVLTPGVAFGNTSLVQKLHEGGITFDIIDEYKI